MTSRHLIVNILSCFILLPVCINFAFGSKIQLESDENLLKERYRYKDQYSYVLDSLEESNNAAFLDYLKELQVEYKVNKNWEGLIYTFTEIGIDLYINSEFDSAILLFDEAIRIGEGNLDKKHPAIARANYYKAQCFFYLGDAQEALKYGQLSLHVFNEYYEYQKSLDISIVLRGLGNVYQYLLADYFKAEEMYQSAVGILEFGEKDENTETRLRLYYNLGVCNFEKFDFEKSLTYNNKALSIIESQTTQKDNYSLESCLALKANALIELGYINEAISILEKALVTNKTNFSLKSNNLLVQHYSNLGFTYTKNREFDKAKKVLTIGLEVANKVEDNDVLLNRSYLLQNLGELSREQNNYPIAINYYNESIRLREKLFGAKHPLVGEGLEDLGFVYEDNGLFKQAAAFFQHALIATLQNFNDSSLLSNPSIKQLRQNVNGLALISSKGRSLLNIYKIDKNKNFLKSALQSFNLADSLISYYQDIYSRETSKLRFLELYHDIYESGIETAFELYQLEKNLEYLENAFYLMEHSKAKLLMDSFKKAQLENRLGIPDSILQKERYINQQIAYYQKEKNNDDFQDKLFELDKQKAQFNQYIKETFPNYYNEKFKEETLKLNAVQSHLKENKQVLLSYYYGKEFLYKATITSDTFYIVKVKNTIKGDISALYTHLQKGFTMGNKKAAFKDFLKVTNSLSKTLLSTELNMNLLKDKNIIISSDFQLSYIPYEVLFTRHQEISDVIDYRSLPYLVKSNNVQYIYSAFELLRKNDKNLGTKEAPNVLAFSFSDHNEKGIVSNVRKMMATIPGAPIELDAIKQLFDGTFLYGAEANEVNFKKNATNYDILHLAVHGTADPQENYGSFLQFRPTSNEVNNGRLFNYELYNLKLKAVLAVLSACESGMGKLDRGEGLLSIGRSFAYAGCPTSMMSLWQVNDNATASIISDFYFGLNEKFTVKEALRNAKLNYIKKSDELTAHPAYWAPMVGYGEDVQLTSNNSWNWFMYSIIFIVIVIISIFFIKKALYSKSKVL